MSIEGKELDLLDVMNPLGMFVYGKRCRDYSAKDVLPLSGRLIPEFDGRRSIRQMFTQGSSLLPLRSAEAPSDEACLDVTPKVPEKPFRPLNHGSEDIDIAWTAAESPSPQKRKRTAVDEPRGKPGKQLKPNTVSALGVTEPKSQQSLKGFFKPKATFITDSSVSSQVLCQSEPSKYVSNPASLVSAARISTCRSPEISPQMIVSEASPQPRSLACIRQSGAADSETVDTPVSKGTNVTDNDRSSVHDPVESKESWSRLFTRPIAPRCEGHNEPCVILSTKKNGINYGRSFWMCPRPLGPTGQKERNTQWRCQTFIWCSDWNSNPTRDSMSGTALHRSS